MLLRLLLLSLTLAGATFVAGSGCEQVKLQCTADTDCDPSGLGFNRCSLEDGSCLCTDDRGCGENEICNSLGRCQADSGVIPKACW